MFTLNNGLRVMAVFAAGPEGVAVAANAHFAALDGTRTYGAMVHDAFYA